MARKQQPENESKRSKCETDENVTSSFNVMMMREMGIKQYKSSAYHPESQEALERFLQTLKSMIKKILF